MKSENIFNSNGVKNGDNQRDKGNEKCFCQELKNQLIAGAAQGFTNADFFGTLDGLGCCKIYKVYTSQYKKKDPDSG